MSVDVLQLGKIDQPTVVVKKDKQGLKVGLAMPASDMIDLYFSLFPSNAATPNDLGPEAMAFAAGILGALEANQVSCTPHTAESILRLDHAGIVQATIAEAADALLLEKHQNRHALVSPLSTLGFAQVGINEALCTPHGTDDVQWRRQLMRALQAAGGIGQLEVWENQAPASLLAKGVIKLPIRESVQADTSPNNLVFVQAWQQEVMPRIEATGLQPEAAAQIIVASSQAGEPLGETLKQVKTAKKR